jgi:hypothetical protein
VTFSGCVHRLTVLRAGLVRQASAGDEQALAGMIEAGKQQGPSDLPG